MLRLSLFICLAMLSAILPAADLSIALHDGSAIVLNGLDARWQLVVNQTSDDGQTVDATRVATYKIEPAIGQIDATGYLRPITNGSATLTAEIGGASCQVALEVTGLEQPQPIDFYHQVVPIMTKAGCNGGGCHGKAAGQAGFKLSLLGFEPQEDYEHLVIESRGRRLFPAIPERSLLLQKAINETAHGGGQRLTKDSHEYDILRRWIATGMPPGNINQRTIERIDIWPQTRQLTKQANQQLSVVAVYTDGSRADVTRNALFESNNTDLAKVDASGFVQLGEHAGDVAVMARYQGKVAVFRASIPLGVPIESFPPTRNLVDEHVFAKLKILGIPPSAECDDSTFIRRATLDICGRLPTAAEAQQFVASAEPNKVEQLVDRLLNSEEYADFFARKWVLILRNKRDSVGEQAGSFAFHQWLKDSFFKNKPYDLLVRELLTASGSLSTNPPLTWWREVSETESRVEDTAQLFLGQRLQCARCHHHPFEKWSQADYYQMAAFFSTVTRKEGPTPEDPMFVSRVANASAAHPRSGQSLRPTGLDAPAANLTPADDPRAELVNWMVDPNNAFFAKSLVNRYWKHFLATGLVEPEDDLRVTNPATNPDLMDALALEFVKSHFDLKQLIRTICTSSTYRLGSDANAHNLSDTSSYARYYPKRLSAEVLLDAIDQAAMTDSSFETLPIGTRAVQLPDTGFGSYFLDVFGLPGGATACECERLNEATLAQSLHLLNSKEIQAKLISDAGRAAAMNASSQPLSELVNDLYWSAFARPAKPDEIAAIEKYVSERPDHKRQAMEDIVWAIVNSKEFIFNH